MNTLIEDPGIPLVGRNGGIQMYTSDSGGVVISGGGIPGPLRRDRKYDNVGYRLAKRKELYQRRKIICDFALAFAIIGVLIMIVETELYMAGVYTKSDTPSLMMKSCISISTATLVGFVIWYHVLDVKLFMCDNSLEDWRLAMSYSRVLKITIEVCTYAIHPIPGNYEFEWVTLDPDTHRITRTMVPFDVIVAIPMFLRFYLVCRVMMLHSKLFTDASSQSLGALNRIHFNFRFIFKSMMTLYPEYVLVVLMLSVFLVASWLLHACEMYHDNAHANFWNALWVVAITFLSVGYGDIVPSSNCGRTIAVLTGIFGALCTALVVAVLANKLELSRAEKYVHNFVMDVELDKRYKHAAANILKYGWFVYKNQKVGKTGLVRRYQRRLLKAIHNIRDVKQEQRRLMDNSVTLVEMHKSQNSMIDSVKKIDSKQFEIEQRVGDMETALERIDKKLEFIANAVGGGAQR